MEPANLDVNDWQRLHTLLVSLYLLVALVLPGAIAFLVAHAVIPSLILTRQLPAPFGRYRVGLYMVAAEAALVGTVLLVRVVRLGHAILQDLYPRWWI